MILLYLFLSIMPAVKSAGCNLKTEGPVITKAIRRADNSFVTYHDPLSPQVPVPAIVEKRIDALYNHLKKTGISHVERVGKLTAFCIRMSHSVDIYVIKIPYEAGISYYLLAFDKEKQSVSKDSPSINGKWMEDEASGFSKNNILLKAPLSYFRTLGPDMGQCIVVKERVHNGSAYNAVVDHFYSLDKQTNLKEILCLESLCVNPMDANSIISRSFKHNSITASIRYGNGQAKIIGSSAIDLKGKNRLKSKKVYVAEFEDFLITGSGIDNEKFLKEGYLLTY
jgi:hypothetical protein